MNQDFYNFQIYVALAERQAERIRKKEQGWHEPVLSTKTQALFRRGVAVVGRIMMSGGTVLQQFAGLSNPGVTANVAHKNQVQGQR